MNVSGRRSPLAQVAVTAAILCGVLIAIAVLTADENRDRMQLYRTLLEQNRMRPADLVRVQAGFARANREQAPSGAWVQDDAGRWSRK